jgi:hypothetical protein
VTSLNIDVENVVLLQNGDFEMAASKMDKVLVSFPFMRNDIT